jgi:hypothetical protein
MFKKLPLVTKLVLAIGFVLLVGLSLGTVVISAKSGEDTDALSFQAGEELGKYHAATVERRLNEAMNVSRLVSPDHSSGFWNGCPKAGRWVAPTARHDGAGGLRGQVGLGARGPGVHGGSLTVRAASTAMLSW